MLVGEAKPILGELVPKAAMGQEIRISTGGFVAPLVSQAEVRSNGQEMVTHMKGRKEWADGFLLSFHVQSRTLRAAAIAGSDRGG